jgi:hypothetical protein
MICLRRRLTRVGILSWKSCQANVRTLEGAGLFQLTFMADRRPAGSQRAFRKIQYKEES